MSLPLSVKSLFNETFEGVPAARLRSTTEAKNLEAALRLHKQSFQTKIRKTKKSGREFIVMLLDPAKEAPSGA